MTLLTVLPSVLVDDVGTPNSVITRLNSLAFTCRYRRFACTLAGTDARLAVIVGRYPFDVELFHLLLHAGLSRRTYDPLRLPLGRLPLPGITGYRQDRFPPPTATGPRRASPVPRTTF